MAVVRDGTPNLWVGTMQDMRPRGDLIQRTFEREGGSYPAWSPDSQWLAYQCTRGTDTDVCVIGADGIGRRQLTNQSGQSWVGGWAADNDRILFAARRDAVWNVATVSRSNRGRADIDAALPSRASTFAIRAGTRRGAVSSSNALKRPAASGRSICRPGIPQTDSTDLKRPANAGRCRAIPCYRQAPAVEYRARPCTSKS